jgi:hypothetical protein
MFAFIVAGIVRAGAADAAVPATAIEAATATATDILPAALVRRDLADLDSDLDLLGLADLLSMGTPFWGWVNGRAP